MPITATAVDSPVSTSAHAETCHEGFIDWHGLTMYRIPDFDAMPPFLVNVVSDGDVWTYVSSGGALTAGRIEPAKCIFPYVTDDLLHRNASHTGPRTALRVNRAGQSAATSVLWEPFRERRHVGTQRNLYKPIEGTQLVFEEIRPDLGLSFCYRWAPTSGLGLVRTAWLENLDPDTPVTVELIDGLMNLVPAGIELPTLQRAGCLINAYTQAEADAATGLVTISLTSRISDTADPHESLTANTVWSHGLEDPAIALTSDAFADFIEQRPAVRDTVRRNLATDYSLRASLTLAPASRQRWDLVVDAARTQSQTVALRKRLQRPADLRQDIDDQIKATRRGLTAIVAASDGQQCTADPKAAAHHFSSAMFNSMRGGTAPDGYAIDVADFLAFAEQRNRPAAQRLADVFGEQAGRTIDLFALHTRLDQTGDGDLIRLGLEYVPLSFGRRHGDPSRPWNMFAIRIQRPNGQRILDYQGNWRDIFQNWEALACSFPGLLDGMIAKFLNATTADGYNPYRISRDGIDWERPDPHDPWANIGYWGDHQIVYLLRLLELWDAHDPGGLGRRLEQRVYSYADVPYRIKPHAEVLRDPKHSIAFDTELDRAITRRVGSMGTDGRLSVDAEERVVHVTMAEKLLVPLLSKVCNLVPGGGIWMNTQRPEWNDANNALAGFGLSVVTTCYLRRYAVFVHGLIASHGTASLQISSPVADWLSQVTEILADVQSQTQGDGPDDRRRLEVLDRLGGAFEAYRAAVAAGITNAVAVRTDAVTKLLDLTRIHAEHTVRQNRRDDGLYHSYNLLDLRSAGKASVRRLDVMLEGQVAVLSSGLLEAQEAVSVLTAMFDSPLYRADVASFMLYPRRDRPGFLEHGVVDADAMTGNALLAEALRLGDRTLVEQDADGRIRFNASFSNAQDVSAALATLARDARFASLVEAHGASVVELFDATFDHHAFTGRSGTMYGYEGLGCVYWHMVAKLQVAAQECWLDAQDADADRQTLDALQRLYERIRDGLGFRKQAHQYGAFPTDAYSHTPGNRGAQQPGMTGQVKEEMLTRRAELGVTVRQGRIRFVPALIREEELLAEPALFGFTDDAGQSIALEVPARSVAFTIAQTPVIVTDSAASNAGPAIDVRFADGTTTRIAGHTLDANTSQELFRRTRRVAALHVHA